MPSSRISISDWALRKWGWKRGFELMRLVRLKALGINRTVIADCRPASIARSLKKSNARASYVAWVGGFTGCDGYSFDDSMEEAYEAIRLCKLLNADNLVVHTGGRAGHTIKHGKEVFTSALRAMLQAAEGMNLTFSIQPWPQPLARRYSLFTSLQDAADFVEQIDSPQVKLSIVLDAWRRAPELHQQRQRLARLTSILHVSLFQADASESPTTELEENVLDVVRGFTSDGYQGWTDVKLTNISEGPSYWERISVLLKSVSAICRARHERQVASNSSAPVVDNSAVENSATFAPPR